MLFGVECDSQRLGVYSDETIAMVKGIPVTTIQTQRQWDLQTGYY